MHLMAESNAVKRLHRILDNAIADDRLRLSEEEIEEIQAEINAEASEVDQQFLQQRLDYLNKIYR